MELLPPTDHLIGLPLLDPSVRAYLRPTRVRVTRDGRTIARIVDTLDAIHGLWTADEFGGVFHEADEREDERPARVRAFDSRVWEGILGDQSPSNEVRYADPNATAQRIADSIYAEYPDSVHVTANDEGVDVRDVLRSLARTLYHDGNARWEE
jgi:hypothetical protein